MSTYNNDASYYHLEAGNRKGASGYALLPLNTGHDDVDKSPANPRATRYTESTYRLWQAAPKDLNQSKTEMINSELLQQDFDSDRKPEMRESEGNVDENVKRKFSGWKVGATAGACTSIAALAVNVAVLVWMSQHPAVSSRGTRQGHVEIYSGSCKKVKEMNLWVHFGINAVSSILLSASNFSMQVLSAPKRHELDRAHTKGKYLDIGVQSLRNLSSISPWRSSLWWVLCLSSIPLHLLYNSAFYSSLSARSYIAFAMTPDWQSFTANQGLPQYNYYEFNDLHAGARYLENLTQHPDALEYLKPADCLNLYAQTIVTGRSNLVLITNDEQEGSRNSSLLDYVFYEFDEAVTRSGSNYHPYEWICGKSPRMSRYLNIPDSGEGCNAKVSKLKNQIEQWTPWDHNIDHCLSERIEHELCRFIGDTKILMVVIVCNAIKILCMLIVAFGLGKRPPLITVGDAISSFLRQPDVTTKGCGLLSRKDVSSLCAEPKKPEAIVSAQRAEIDNGTRASSQILTWSRAASHKRWKVTIGCILLAVLVVLVFFGIGYGVVSGYAGESITSIGFGKTQPAAIVTSWPISNTLFTALVANIPQLIFSFLYVNLNSLVTCMWLASEWNDFSLERKSLRVSLPRAEQRSTYFLQLPYRVGVPLIIVSSLMHWLISESLFLAIVEIVDWEGGLSKIDIISLGFSLQPMLIVMVTAVGLCVGTIALGRTRKLKGEGFMPVASSCSLAIAAACHAPAGDEKAYLTAVMWGAVAAEKHVPENCYSSYPAERNSIGHCSFTSRNVEQIQEGRLYA
ncbi:hypothetical protein LTR84_000176 [Exophiala bonariae]|uniref:DUF6536 domain-containing protein n=1 Tax=Exophiala bonariae TaxID=1690606 RepID=A0AAV9NTJ9_9EURO|nr:hypothetical protein LTR84_000176 [Exophiala bonariae]